MADGGAGSFELRVDVELGPGPPLALTLRVAGDLSVGGLVLRVVDAVGERRDWSGHALWWPQRRRWLLRPRPSLDALALGADAALRFLPRRRPLRVRLPCGRRVRMRVDFAQPAAGAAAEACALLGIRYPEELSLLWPDEEEEAAAKKGRHGREGDNVEDDEFDLSDVVLPPGPEGSWSGCPPHLDTPSLRGFYQMLVAPWGGRPPRAPPRLPPSRDPPLVQRAKINSRWLDSSRSLLEQDVADDAELLLRFKYCSFLDLQPQVDAVRISQLYEQARWALLREEIDCTEEELMLFAALQYHIDGLGAPEEPPGEGAAPGGAPDDLDAALERLELRMGGAAPAAAPPLEELTAAPELKEYLDVLRPRRLALRGFRPLWLELRGATLSSYKSPQALAEPVQQLNLKGCQVVPDVDVAAQRFCLKLLLPTAEGMSDVTLRCRDAAQCARWLPALRAASSGLPGTSLDTRGLLALLGGAGPEGGPAPGPAPRAPPDPRLLLPPRALRRIKGKQLTPRILAALPRGAPLSALGARLSFLQAWQALPAFGLAYFLVRFQGGAPRGAPGRGPVAAPAAGAVRAAAPGVAPEQPAALGGQLGERAGGAGAGGAGDGGPERPVGPVSLPARVPGRLHQPGGPRARAPLRPGALLAAHGGAPGALSGGGGRENPPPGPLRRNRPRAKPSCAKEEPVCKNPCAKEDPSCENPRVQRKDPRAKPSCKGTTRVQKPSCAKEGPVCENPCAKE